LGAGKAKLFPKKPDITTFVEEKGKKDHGRIGARPQGGGNRRGILG
jgi:hypothetical protein